MNRKAVAKQLVRLAKVLVGARQTAMELDNSGNISWKRPIGDTTLKGLNDVAKQVADEVSNDMKKMGKLGIDIGARVDPAAFKVIVDKNNIWLTTDAGPFDRAQLKILRESDFDI